MFHSDTECIPGYEGPLCQTCQIQGNITYTKYGNNQCVPCFSKEINILIISLLLVGYSIFICIMIKYVFFIIFVKNNFGKN